MSGIERCGRRRLRRDGRRRLFGRLTMRGGKKSYMRGWGRNLAGDDAVVKCGLPLSAGLAKAGAWQVWILPRSLHCAARRGKIRRGGERITLSTLKAQSSQRRVARFGRAGPTKARIERRVEWKIKMAGLHDRPFLFWDEAAELLGAFVFGRGFLQRGQESLCAGWNWHLMFEDDVLGADFLAVEFFVGVVVGAQR